MSKVTEEYGVKQITKLEGLDPIRRRPGMYIGSTSQLGIDQLLYEVIDNSVDEFVAGWGKEINILINKDCSVKVIDYGRGIPVGKSEIFRDRNGNPIDTLTGVLTNIHAGGKFGKGGYIVSCGLHGAGSKCVNALSDFFDVIVKRDGFSWHQSFAKGVPTSSVEKLEPTNETGTIVVYRPDKTIFKTTIQPSERVKSRLKELSFLNAGLKITYDNKITNEHQDYFYHDGIEGYTLAMVEGKNKLYDQPFTFSKTYSEENEHDIICDISFIHDDDSESITQIKTFANNINTYDGGYHLKGFKDAYKDCINAYALDKKLIKEPLEMQYLMDGLHAVVSIKLYEPEFEGQTKTKLGNEEAQKAVSSVVHEFFNEIAKKKNYKPILEAIINRANNIKIAELAARTARLNARKTKKLSNMALPAKLADCQLHDGFSELYIVEGDSAGNSIKLTRNKSFQSCLPLRGKILNVSKSELVKVLSSDSVKGIISSLGTGIGKNFDITKLRYDKVIIATDADVD